MKGYSIDIVSQNPPRFKKDRSATISFDTGELTDDEKMSILRNDQLVGALAFIPEGESSAKIEKINAAYDGKSPGERLHGALYVLWKQRGGDGDFNVFYGITMERFIDGVKAKIDEQKYI